MTTAPTLARRPIWGEAWRLAVAAALGLLFFVINVGFSLDLGADGDSARFAGLVLLDLAVGVIAHVVFPFRRRAPLAIAVGLALGAAVSSLAAPAALLALVSLATRRRPGEIAATVIVWVAAITGVVAGGFDLLGAPAPAADLALTVGILLVVLAATVAVGVSIGARRALVVSLRERALLVEEEQRLREAAARDHERTRIAREMHDVLAHRLSLTAMHASALRYRDDLDDGERAAAVETVHENARGALGELRGILAVVRDPEAADADRPQPTLADLDELLATTDDVEARVEVDLATLAPAIGRHAYRIVQECLTNARRHAPGAAVTLRVTGEPGDRLEIDVANPMFAKPSGSPGFGLVGIEERTRAVGGTTEVTAGPRVHRVHVTLPWSLA
ncbi:signal transduction histidine kinase [Microbacterium testaceum StLB037]|uniref:histidine kinase n=1 Tax=Microbacterium testaceum (strain StLB037) TaxID=979556 RepID=E8NEN2_MICTS|nr:histidine kinase [Microbacterium testaceum]BAJ75117.1 signal transduction histidine kinase [Microbacterium testaceum StLB037]